MHEEIKQVITESMNARFEIEHKLIQRAWEDETFKQELLSNPRAVFERESGQEIPKSLEIEVIQETANKVYLVLPTNPAPDITNELSEEALESVAGGVSGCTLWSRIRKVCIGWSAVSNANSLT
ncbi:MAG: NHLP leader peptide family RiPP precursor [Mojavia pulchra JT2-VF2]|jgi:ribosomal protein S18 acetylase RimI-like enzyme|uniref:NHLP leader peptide family RiPP n=1 Tax=Mojavia pulchra JT2-VF2 TaxID=287848 RepID=A0A951UH43_9NOST|nr:NHLP leader peptide family RiPP precursor [Mojavia pulchra JT2-VF2]